MKGIIPTCIVGMLINITQGAFFGFAPVLLEDLGYNLMGMFVFFIPGILIFFAGSDRIRNNFRSCGTETSSHDWINNRHSRSNFIKFLIENLFYSNLSVNVYRYFLYITPSFRISFRFSFKRGSWKCIWILQHSHHIRELGGVLIVGFVIQFYSIYALFGFSAILMRMCRNRSLFNAPDQTTTEI